jgi:hypothetical protein
VSTGRGQQPRRDAVHLVTADEAAQRGYGSSTLVAVCGAQVCASSPAPADDDPKYCLDCVASAARWSATADDHELRPAVVR